MIWKEFPGQIKNLITLTQVVEVDKMIEMICVCGTEKNEEIKDLEKQPGYDGSREPQSPHGQAVVPTIDLYSARVLFSLTQKMVEDALDRRVSLLEKRIEERDREVLRTVRKIQTRMMIQQSQVKLPWWRRLFKRENAK